MGQNPQQTNKNAYNHRISILSLSFEVALMRIPYILSDLFDLALTYLHE